MKKKLLVGMVAIVAIFSPQSSVWAQEATPEQLAEMALQEKQLSEQQEEAQRHLQVLRTNVMTPEQLLRYKEVQKRIAAIPKPPMPTNRPSIVSIEKSTSSQNPSDEMRLGERMALRNNIILNLMTNGQHDSISLNRLNTHIQELNSERVNPASIRSWILGTDEPAGVHRGSGGGDIYEPYNTAPFTSSAWSSINNPSHNDYPWGLTTRTLVPTNGPAVQSWSGFYEASDSTLVSIFPNHVDYWGDDVRHILAFWYKLYGVHPLDLRNISIIRGSSVFWQITPDPAFSWTHLAYIVPTSPASLGSLQFRAYLGKFYISMPRIAVMELDPSIRWIPMTLDPINEDFVIERVGNEMWVQWNNLVYQEAHWQLTFATSLQGTYSSSIGVPVTIDENEVATAKFPIATGSNQRRFFRLKHF